MRQLVSLFLTASIIFLSQGVQGSNINHDDDGDAPASAPAAPHGVVTSVSTHSGLTLCNPQALVSMDARSFNLNALASFRGVPFFNPLQTRYMQAIHNLAKQTGNSALFMQDHFADFSHLTLAQLEKLVPEDPIKGPLEEPLKGALNPETPEGQAYFKLKAILEDTSQVEVFYGNKGLRLCPPLRDATHLRYLDLSNNQLTVAPVLSGLTHLRTLALSNNQLREAPVVSGLTHLRTLALSNNQLREAPVVSGLKNLVGLYLYNNQLRDAPDVTGLSNLRGLYLCINKLTVAPVLTGLTNLVGLYLDSNLCGDPTLLETLRDMNSKRDYLNRIRLFAVSKDAAGKEVTTEVSLN